MSRRGPRVCIEVTTADIKAAVRKSCTQCPIALALRRAGFGPLAEVRNGIICNRAVGGWWSLSKRAMAFIEAFDTGKRVSPARFYTSPRPY